MSATGSLFIITDEELKNQINNDFSGIESLKENTDLSYFAFDFLELLNSYSGLDTASVGKILQGDASFSPEDGFIGYSTAVQAKHNKENILDTMTTEVFASFWEKGEKDNHFAARPAHKTILFDYFENIKKSYATAVEENKALLFRIG